METDLLIFPNNDDIKLIEEEFGEDSEKFKHQLSLFENWLCYQKHLPQNFSRTILSHFLRLCKMNLEKTKTKFEIYCYLQLTSEKFFNNRKVSLDGDLSALDFIYICPMPELTPNGYRITVLKYYNTDKYELVSICRYFGMLADYRLHNETYIMGDIVVFDFEICELRTYAKIFQPTLLYFLKIALAAYPCRIKQVFIIHNSLFERTINIGINMCKAILSEKLRNRIYVIYNKADLKKYIPEKYLPSDYNGSQRSLLELNDGWRHLMLKNVEFFENISKMRPLGEIPKYMTHCDENLGIDGSFRKLNID